VRHLLRPLRGLAFCPNIFPRLAPWATFFCPLRGLAVSSGPDPRLRLRAAYGGAEGHRARFRHGPDLYDEPYGRARALEIVVQAKVQLDSATRYEKRA